MRFLTEADWDKAINHLYKVISEYEMIGCIELTNSVKIVKDRIDKGERSEDLYDMIMSTEV